MSSGGGSPSIATPARTCASVGSGRMPVKTRTLCAERWRRTSSATPRSSLAASVTMTACSAVMVRRFSSAPVPKYVSEGTRNHCGGVCRRETALTLRRLR